MLLAQFLRDAVVPQRTAEPLTRQHKNGTVTIDADLDEGERIHAHMRRQYGAEAAADFVQQAAGAPYGRPIPYGFYRKYIEEELHMTYERKKRQSLYRSFKVYAERKATGAVMRVGFRGERKKGSCRGGGGRQFSKNCPELGSRLLQFFVDRIQNL